MLFDETILKGIIETIISTTFFCYGFMFLFFVWVLVSIFDAIDAYKWRRKMPIILAAEMIKQTEEALDMTSFEYGQDYE